MSLEPLETLSTISPTTNNTVLRRQALSPQEIARLPAAGQQAFASYRTSHPTLGSRQEVVAKALKFLSDRKDVLAKELTEQMGRPIAYTGVEIDTAVKRGQHLNKIAGEVLSEDVPGEPEKGFRRFIRREPVGVVLIIFAWNVSQSLLPTYPPPLVLTTVTVSIPDPHQLPPPCAPCWQRGYPQAFSANAHHC